jgi:putative endonuclease
MNDFPVNKSAAENHVEAGRRGEDHALFFLQDKGYQLVRRNYRHGRGEIDLVMEGPDNVLVFVEVKSNRTRQAGNPLERVDARKIRQLQRMAQRYCWEFRQEDRDMRFDVVGVDLAADGTAAMLHVEAAFIPDSSGYHPSR